jgi:hypothetical protein
MRLWAGQCADKIHFAANRANKFMVGGCCEEEHKFNGILSLQVFQMRTIIMNLPLNHNSMGRDGHFASPGI